MEIDIRQIFGMIKRWLWLLILVSLIAAGAGYYISNLETPRYQTSTRFVLLRPETPGGSYFAQFENQQLIQTYSQLLTSDSLISEVSEKLGYPVSPGAASTSQISDTQFIRLTVTHTDPVKAAEIANALINVLIEQNQQLQSIRYELSEENLQERADNALWEMELQQAQIEALTETNLQEQIARVESEIDSLQPDIIELQAIINGLQENIAEVNPQFATEQELANIEAQKRVLAERQAELDQLKSILSKYQQIYTNLVVMQEPLSSSGDTSMIYTRARINLNLYQQIYLQSLSSLEALNLSRAQSTPTVVQLEPARVPNAPISPRPMQSAALFGAVGLIGMAGIAFMVEYLDDTIKTQVDVETHLGLPVLGYVAEIKNGGGKRKDQTEAVITAVQPRSPASESFRSLRTNLEFFNFESSINSLIISSPVENVGKTTVSTNLAIVIAQNDKRVVLIDADLRRPNVHKVLNLTNRAGLSEVLRGNLEIDDVIKTSETIKNFHIITSGSLPPNPADLLGSKRMKSIIAQLEKEFDWVILDTPPAFVTDAHILSTIADGILFVIEPGKVRTTNAKKPLEEFRRMNANMLGVVMNRIPKNKEYYYSGGYYYYSKAYTDSQYHRPEDNGDVPFNNVIPSSNADNQPD